METTLSTKSLPRTVADVAVIPVHGNAEMHAEVRELDAILDGHLLAEIKRQHFTGSEDQQFTFQTHGALPTRNLVLIGCQSRLSTADYYRIADALAHHAACIKAASAAVLLGEHAAPASVAAITEGVTLARYRYTRFLSKHDLPEPLALTIVVPRASGNLERALVHGNVSAAATCYARDLANTPAGALPPRALAREALRLAGTGLSVKVHDLQAIKRLKMGALLAVAQGSREAPRFIELVYRPGRKPRRRVALVGKGITFDSGGLSLKPPAIMEEQKRDMAGAAVVLAVMRALPELRPAVEVRGYVPAAENMPGGGAIRPGDIVRTSGGTTIEILNTDAEGRLILADALSYAAGKKPDSMLDFATMTSAVRLALGNRYGAIMGTDRALVNACLSAASEAGENLWELPLAPEYRRDIDSRIADLKNTGAGYASTIVGGLFLREFVGDIPWAHVDFSSTVMSDGYACHPKGASGFGVRTALRYLVKLGAQRPRADVSP